MTRKLPILLFFLLLCGALHTYAQQNQDEALLTYELAQDEYDNNNYTQALKYLDEVDRLSEASRTKTSYLRAKCYFEMLSICPDLSECYSRFLSSCDYYLANGKDEEKKKWVTTAKTGLGDAEEQLWAGVKKMHTLSGYQNYIADKKILRSEEHIRDATRILREGMIYYVEKYVDEANVPEMEASFQNFTVQFPNDQESGRLKNRMADVYFAKAVMFADQNSFNEMEQYFSRYLRNTWDDDARARVNAQSCKAYYREGLVLLNTKEPDQLKHAKNVLNEALRVCGSELQISNLLKKCDRKIRRYSRPDRSYYTYCYDFSSPFGLSFGGIKTRFFGAYITFRANEHMSKGFDVLYTIDDKGSCTHPGKTLTTDERVTANAEVAFGVTKKIFYPFWLYLGFNAGYYPVYEKVDTYFDSGTAWETVWVKNIDHSKWLLGPDFGLIVDLSGFNLRFGAKGMGYMDWVFTCGIGFSIQR